MRTVFSYVLLLLVCAFATGSSVHRVRRGLFVGGGTSYGGPSTGHVIGSGYSGGSSGIQVLLAGGGGGGGGGGYHTLNTGGVPAFTPSGGAEQHSYTYAAQAAGDLYSAKTIAQGQFDLSQADASAAAAAYGVLNAANDPALAAAVQYSAAHAQSASLSAAAHNGAAAVVTGAAYRSSYH